ncbi:MAG: hypothetical protein HY425_02640 [Candidatus Levybacteria bacterium]|nr:hypothetical protein [Candidatus Levybacteria bacterium]
MRKLIRIGNSVGVTLDKKMLRELGMDGLIWVWIEADKKKIIIRKREGNEW